MNSDIGDGERNKEQHQWETEKQDKNFYDFFTV